MKLPLTLSAFILFFSGYSQPSTHSPSGNDSSVSCIAYWKLGDTKVYSIVHEKNTINTGSKTAPFKFAYEAWISVTDSTAKSYTIKWVFHLPEAVTIFRPALADSLPVYNGMQMIFRVTEMGAFAELLNWEEVRDAYSRMLELSLPQKKDSTMAAILQSTKNLYNSKEIVESSLIKEIQLFHLPFGYKFTATEVGAPTEIANPFGGQPLPAIQTTRIAGLNLKKDSFTLVFNLLVDKANTKSIIDSVIAKMNIKDDYEMQAAREKYASFDLHDYSEYHFIRSSGWLRRLYYKRTVAIAGTTQDDAYTITLKN